MKLRWKILFAMALASGASVFFALGGESFDIKEVPLTSRMPELVRRARATAARPAPTVAVRLAVIKTASSASLEALTYSGGSRMTAFELSHCAILVRHGEAALLFDTGLGEQVTKQFGTMPAIHRQLLAFTDHRSAKSQLIGADVSVDSIQYIALSHMHWDHASGLEDFPGAEVWTTEEELSVARTTGADNPAYILQQYTDETIRWKFLEFPDGPYGAFDKSKDVFGDGAVVLVPMRGHTPGSMGMFVNLPSGKRLLFTGDTTWALEGFTKPADKHWSGQALADRNVDQVRESIVRVRASMEGDPQLLVVPAHDNRVHEKLGLFPSYIE